MEKWERIVLRANNIEIQEYQKSNEVLIIVFGLLSLVGTK